MDNSNRFWSFLSQVSGECLSLVEDFSDELPDGYYRKITISHCFLSLSLTCRKFRQLCNDRVLLSRDVVIVDQLSKQLGLRRASGDNADLHWSRLSVRVGCILRQVSGMSLVIWHPLK